MMDDLRERLEETARERWDDRWTIEARYFADGSERLHAYSNQGQTPDGEQIREQLLPGADDELHIERVVVTGGESVVSREIVESPVE